ncbi:hypothetical protein [Ammoniphilus sp. YIM 78166]|uniref:hypothetical protein n=1 Tax=Ammoniphilus sp. YIM 78166 TaxID=1644106 RepID=UPI0010701C3C|nr:hypothetical protein [Ammoniphilus sp. YIM 78166]
MILNIISTILAFFCAFLTSSASAAQQDTTNRVIVILINHLSLEDIQTMQTMDSGTWLNQGIVGAMNLRTAAEINEWNNLITMNSGTRAVGNATAGAVFMGNERIKGIAAREVYQQLVGSDVREAAVVIPSFKQLVDNNKNQPYSIMPGLLGETIKLMNRQVFVFGNSDKGEELVRFAPLLAMDSRGTVQFGDVSQRTTLANPERVYGLSTNYPYLLAEVQKHRDQASLMVIELGDLYRLYSMKQPMDEAHFAKMKKQVFEETNDFMNRLLAGRTKEELVLLVTPMVHSDAHASKSMMSPFIHIGGHSGEGSLSTPTTRQAGIIANVDVAPTILHWLGIEAPSAMIGRPVQVVQEPTAFWAEWEQIKHVYGTRSTVLYGYVIFQVVVLILSAAFWLLANPAHRMYNWVNRTLRFLLIVITLSPFLFLILPMFPVMQAKLTIVFLLILGTGLSAAVIRLPFPWLFFIISLVNWAPVLLDGIGAQSALMKRSYLGYDPIIGARYYGIGNEYMGVVIGSTILSFAMLLELTKKYIRVIQGLALTVFGLFLVFFSSPGWGTNAGGAITAITAYSTSFIRLFDIRINKRLVGWVVMIGMAGMGVLFAMNMSAADQAQSHIGRAMQKLVSGDWQEIWNIIERKWAMNWKLIGVSSWSKVFITSLLVLGVLCYRPAGMIGRLSVKYPYAVRGFFGIIIGAFTALAINDSGIVAAATTIIYMVVPLLFLGLKEKMGVGGRVDRAYDGELSAGE